MNTEYVEQCEHISFTSGVWTELVTECANHSSRSFDTLIVFLKHMNTAISSSRKVLLIYGGIVMQLRGNISLLEITTAFGLYPSQDKLLLLVISNTFENTPRDVLREYLRLLSCFFWIVLCRLCSNFLLAIISPSLMTGFEISRNVFREFTFQFMRDSGNPPFLHWNASFLFFCISSNYSA